MNSRPCYRKSAVAPLMALLLPVLLLFCGIVVNVAYMQLNRTELRVATDSASRAAGRAFSEFQDIDIAIEYAVSTAAMNNVGAKSFELDSSEVKTDPSHPATSEITFGSTTRLRNGYGRYEFIPKDRSAVRNLTEPATSIRIVGRRTSDSLGGAINMLFAGWGPFSEFEPIVASTTTQVDRDIALVLDRSGSMLEYKDLEELDALCLGLYNQGKISYTEYERGGKTSRSSWFRYYPYNVGNTNPKHYHLSKSGNTDAWQYCKDMTDRAQWSDYWGTMFQYLATDPAPRHSRWAQLEVAVSEFLTVLEGTEQQERVSMITFNSSGTQDLALQSEYNTIRNAVSQVIPVDGTNISGGMETGLSSITNTPANPEARPYAAKTIVVMTDGTHTVGDVRPPDQARSIVDNNNVVIHTVTFTPGVPIASRLEMAEVANIGGGKHYHADNGEELVAIFREIANNLPTIITE